MTQQVHILVTGLVQGVAFRFYTCNEAKRLNLKGFVRNLSDGRVEILAEGDSIALEEFISWTHKGSPAARVDDVHASYKNASGRYDDFLTSYE